MLAHGALGLFVLLAALDPAQVEDELRRARNEYSYGNLQEAADRLRALLYPMQLTTDAQVIEARTLLALSYYLLDRPEEVSEEFAKILFLDPDRELDAFSVAPSVIELFESLRQKLKPELDVIRQRQTNTSLKTPHGAGVRRVVERRIVERSDLGTFMPFGVGQFQNGDTAWGVFFATAEVVLLAANIGAYMWGLQLRSYTPARRALVQSLAVTQYASLALLGATWSVGVFHARQHFVSERMGPALVRDEPMDASAALHRPTPRGLSLAIRF